MRFSSKKPLVAVLALTVAGACAVAGCAPAQNQTSNERISQKTAEATVADWAALYPLEYGSFATGGATTEDMDVVPTRESFSHSTMAKYMEKRVNSDNGLRGVCVACKSSSFNELYDEIGDDVFSKQPSGQIAEIFSAEDWWSCTTCHSDIDNPAGSVGAQISAWKYFGGSLYEAEDAGTAVCAQCHNNANTWMSSIATSMDDATAKNPYRYGWDADAMMRAVLEDKGDAAKTVVDEETGAYIIANGGHPDAELFQGSAMQQAGLTCISCHMPEKTDPEGNTYRSHDSSASPLESYDVLESCLTCHSKRGQETTEQMMQLVRSAQAQVADMNDQVLSKMASLNDAMRQAKAAGTSEDALNVAREAYAKAEYYREYVLGNNDATPTFVGARGERPGEKVAHNPQLCREYLQRASALLDDAQAALA